jgi:hypothetical protein
VKVGTNGASSQAPLGLELLLFIIFMLLLLDVDVGLDIKILIRVKRAIGLNIVYCRGRALTSLTLLTQNPPPVGLAFGAFISWRGWDAVAS